MIGSGQDYVVEIAAAIGALESVQSTSEEWADSADGYAEVMRTQENALAAIGDNIPIDDAEVWMQRRSAITNAMDTIRADWKASCTTFAGRLADDTTTLWDCNLALLEVFDARAVNDNVYVASVSELSVVAAIDISVVDGSGWLEEKVSERAAFLGSEDGALMFLVIETANQEDIGKADGNLSGDDFVAATDPVVVRALLLQAGEEHGHEWEPEHLDAMVAEIVGTAWTMRAGPDEEWEDIDDDIEWYENGVFTFVREELFAPALAGLVGGLCYGAATATAPTTGGASLGAAGYCGGLTAATYSAADTWAHGGDAGEVLDAFTDPPTWLAGAATGIAFQGATNLLLRTPATTAAQTSLTRSQNGLFGTNVKPLRTLTGNQGYPRDAATDTVQMFQTEAHGGSASAARFFTRQTGVVPTGGTNVATGADGLRYTLRGRVPGR